MESTNAPIGDSFITQKDAEDFVENLLRLPDWLSRRQSPDLYLDFHVELIDDKRPSGFEFGIQVKGSKRGKRSSLKTRMECKHLTYYRDQARWPVFIILVDLVARNAHWVFAQKHLRECASKEAVDEQRTFTIAFHPANALSDLAQFREAVREADHYMRELYPGSPTAAVSAKEIELQKLDPEIKVKVSFDNGEIIHFDSTKPLNYTLRGLGLEAFQSFQTMLDDGTDFEACAEITPPDSPLFAKLMTGKEGYFRFTPERPPGFVQIIRDATQEVIQINGQWRVGRKSIRFEGSLEKSPLDIALTIEDWLQPKNARISLETPFSLRAWEGQLLLRLAWFDQIRPLVSALASGEELTIVYFLHGTKVGQLQALVNKESQLNPAIESLHEEIEWLAKAREVAIAYRVDVKLPSFSDISPQMRSAVEALDDLARGRLREESISGERLECLGSPGFEFPVNSPAFGTVKLIGSVTFDFLGQEVSVSNVEQILAGVQLLRENTAADRFMIEGCDGATLSRRKIAA